MAMRLTLKRRHLGATYTIGSLSIDGEYFCDTLELPLEINGVRNVRQKCCIPAGTYKVIMKQSARFGMKLPLLLNVPYRQGILIHAGNTSKDTAGCVLIGENKEVGKVLNSRATLTRLLNKIKYEKDLKITIE
jgi:hypothetical protein